MSFFVSDSEIKGVTKIVDYISFHHNSTTLRVKDIGCNTIYLVELESFNITRLESNVRRFGIYNDRM